MKIIIVGNGKVGYAIASQLAGERHDIVMVDNNAVALHRAENALDVMCIEGNGASIRVLQQAGAQRFARLMTAEKSLGRPSLRSATCGTPGNPATPVVKIRSR